MLVASIAVVYLAYALLLPAFEGPDEPFHLSRALDLARSRFVEGWRAERLGDDVVAALRLFPCGPDLERAFGCPSFETAAGRAWGNLLKLPVSGPASDTPREPYPNYERQHPLFGYLIWSIPLHVVDRVTEREPAVARVAVAQLTVRLANLAILAIALLGPGRRLVAGWSNEARAVGLGVLLLPGAVETLARGGLEALVFAWSLSFIEESLRSTPRTTRVLLLAALGPLIKLTAIPVVVFGVAAVWGRGRRAPALGMAVAGGAVYLERLVRGFLAGGVLDLHAQYSTHDPGGAIEIARGIGWSLLVTAKSALWLGGWSFFRPPLWGLVLIGAAAVLVLSQARVAREAERDVQFAALAGALVALAGHAVFSIAVYRVFGSWAVGGWYVWAWFPAAAIATQRMLDWRRPVRSWLLPAAGAALATVDVAWWLAADRLYG